MVSLWNIFAVFSKIGAFTIGGGYAMIPLIQNELGKRGWISEEELPDIIALAQSAPGILAVNVSIFAGYRLRGVKGSITATIGTVLPSFLMILLIAMVAVVLTACGSSKAKNNDIKVADDEVIVYFCKDITPENILKLYEALGVKQEGKIGLKVHFGEDGNQNFLNPELLRPLVKKTNATFVETNVLYVSKRRFTDQHIALAKEHGFTFAPIDILDDEGEIEYAATGLKHFDKIKTGSHFANYDAYIIYSHFKGQMRAL